MNEKIALTRSLEIIVALVIILFITGCSTTKETDLIDTSSELVTLIVSGSGGTTPIITAIADSFEAETPGYQIETLRGTGTSGGVQGVIEAVLDVAAMGRAPKAEEAEKIDFFSLGFGAEVPFVHGDLTFSELSSAQLQGIFSGEITNWSDVGGPDLPIVVYVRAADTPHTEVLKNAFLGDVVFSQFAQVMGGMGDIISAVEGTPGAIGYVNWPTALALEAQVNPLAIDGKLPTDKDYPAVLEIGIGYLPEREVEIKPLLDWLNSETGQQQLGRYGVIQTN